MSSEEGRKLIEYGEDINELIYIKGEVEFRENKTLSEKPKADTYPPLTDKNSRERQYLTGPSFSLPTK